MTEINYNKIPLGENTGKVSDFDDVPDLDSFEYIDLDNDDPTDLIRAFREALAPARRVTCDVWADENVELDSGTSAEPGPWRTQRFPFMREILQKLSPTDPATHIYLAKGVQVSASAAGIVTMLTFADTDPCPIMYVMPTIAMAEDFSKDKVQPMINSAVALRDKFKDPRLRDSGNTILGKRYPGGFIVFAGANAAASLRSRSIRLLILDEVDAYPHNIEKEGSPITLAEARTVSFGAKKKIFMPSTPTVDKASAIWLYFQNTDQRHYHVPCPHCHHKQNLVFEQLYWKPQDPDSCEYICIECGGSIQEDRYKTYMLDNGVWISHMPERRNDFRIGYHINSLYSPYGWLSWRDIAREYEMAVREQLENQEDNHMRTFYNTKLGLPFATAGEQPDWQKLYDKHSEKPEGGNPNNNFLYNRNQINEHVKLITVGVDVQKDRVEFEIVGWGHGKRSWSIDYRVFEGEISDKDLQQAIRDMAEETWLNPNKVSVPVHKICIDSGWNTTAVYDFCRTLDHDKFVPTKGQQTLPTVFSSARFANKTELGEGVAQVRYYMLGTDAIKDEVYDQLKKTKDVDDQIGPPGYCHFPKSYLPIYFQGLTAEKKVTEFRDGYPVRKYVNEFGRNEPLDTRVYARAALGLSGYEEYGDEALDMIFADYKAATVEEPKKAKRKSDYW